MPDPRLAALDRPVWNALTSGWAPIAEGDGGALRMGRDYGVFGAAADGSAESLDALARLVPDNGGELWLIEKHPPAVPGTRVVRSAALVQMAAEAIVPGREPDGAVVELTDDDAAAMYELAALTKPGPYAAHTNRLGGFIGVRRDGQLIAMAGERMRMPGLTEVSGVCTHPDWRGRGLAGALMRIVAQRMVGRGEVPFLHAYADNAGAIALYESLGFRIVGRVAATVLVRDPAEAPEQI